MKYIKLENILLDKPLASVRINKYINKIIFYISKILDVKIGKITWADPKDEP